MSKDGGGWRPEQLIQGGLLVGGGRGRAQLVDGVHEVGALGAGGQLAEAARAAGLGVGVVARGRGGREVQHEAGPGRGGGGLVAVVRQILLRVLVLAAHPGVVLLLVPHQRLLDRELLVADVAGEGFVVDVGEHVLPQLVGGHELARAEDAVDPPAHLVLLDGLGAADWRLLDLRVHLGRLLVHVLVLIVCVLVLVLYVRDHVVPGDEVFVTQVTLEVAGHDAHVVLGVVLDVLVLGVVLPELEAELVVVAQLEAVLAVGRVLGVAVFADLVLVF